MMVVITQMVTTPLSLLFPAKPSLLSHPLFAHQVLQSLDNICAPLLSLFRCVHVFLVVRSPELELELQVSFSSVE